MKSVVLVGAQWGDEGKGKVVDYLAGAFDYIARVAGGHNAGHTVIIGKDHFVLPARPLRDFAPYKAGGHRHGRCCRSRGPGRRDRDARKGRRRRKGPPAPQQSRPSDFSIPSRTGPRRRKRPRRGQDWHHVARYWSCLRRPDGAPRAARLRSARSRAFPRKSRPCGRREESPGKRRLRRGYQFFPRSGGDAAGSGGRYAPIFATPPNS